MAEVLYDAWSSEKVWFCFSQLIRSQGALVLDLEEADVFRCEKALSAYERKHIAGSFTMQLHGE